MEMENRIEEKDSFIIGATIKINNLTHIIEKLKNKFHSLKNQTRKLREKNKKMKILLKRSLLGSNEESKLSSDDNNISDSISDNFNLKNEAISCYSFEKLDKNEDNKSYTNSPKLIVRKTNKENEELKIKTAKYLLEIEKLQKTIIDNDMNFQNRYQLLNSEILKLTQRNFLLNSEINKKNSEINKLESQNILILNELIELVHSLRTIDIKKLNRIFLENLSKKKKEDLEILNVSSCLGIKYNILSAESFLSYLINTKKNKDTEKENMFEPLKENFPNTYKHLNIDNYKSPIRSENLIFKGKCNLDFGASINNENKCINLKNIEENNNGLLKKKTIKDENEIKIKKNYEEDDIFDLNRNDKISFKEKSLYNSLFDLEDSDSISDNNSIERYLEANYPNDTNPLFVYELPKEIQNNQCADNLIENQNKMASKVLNLSKYEDHLNFLLERNLKKTKLLSYPDSE